MNWDRIEGRWKQLKGRIHKEWGHWIHSPSLEAIGHQEQVTGKIQERYGLAREVAERHLISSHDRESIWPADKQR